MNRIIKIPSLTGILLLIGIIYPFQGSGQGVEYILNKGDILTYEIKQHTEFVYYEYYQTDVQFEVLSEKKGDYLLQMTVLNTKEVLRPNTISDYNRTTEITDQVYKKIRDRYIGEKIKFRMDKHGIIKDFINSEAISKAFIQLIIKDFPEQMNVVYSEDFSKENIENYYKEIIQMVFRDISQAQSDSIIEFKPRVEELKLFSNTEGINDNNHIYIGRIILEKNIPDLISIGTESSINTSPQISIERTDPDLDKKGKAWIHAKLKDQEGSHFILIRNNDKLESKPIKYTIDSEEYDSIFEIPMLYGSDIIDLYYDYPPIRFIRRSRYLYQKQISLYLKRGDTVKFSYNDRDSTFLLNFEGVNSKENYLLNTFPYYELLETESFLKRWDDTKAQLLEYSGFSNDFYEKASFKLDYLKHYSSIVNRGFNLDYNQLLELSTFTNNKRHTNFKEYRDFLHAYSDNKMAIALESWSFPNKYDAIQLFFDGWDESYLQASRILENLRDPSNYSYEGSRADYERYLQDHPNSPFSKELKEEFKTATTFRVNSKLPVQLRREIKKLGKKQQIKNSIIITIDDGSFFNNFLFRSAPVDVTFILFRDQDKMLNKYGRLHYMDSLIFTSIGVHKKLIEKYLPIQGRGILLTPDYEIKNVGPLYSMENLKSIDSWDNIRPQLTKTISVRVLIFGISSIILATILIILYFRIRTRRLSAKLKLDKKISDLELSAIRARMNPHFLFNCLASIQSLVNLKQLGEANIYLARFGEMVRKILYFSNQNMIGLDEEIEFLETYLSLEKLRFHFNYSITLDPDLDAYQTEIPPLLVQPHVENAVNHGVSDLGENGVIEIRFRKENNTMVVTVADNGPGMGNSQKPSSGMGQGWKLTQQKVELLKKKLGDVVTISYEDSFPSGGTVVRFVFPLT